MFCLLKKYSNDHVYCPSSRDAKEPAVLGGDSPEALFAEEEHQEQHLQPAVLETSTPLVCVQTWTFTCQSKGKDY